MKYPYEFNPKIRGKAKHYTRIKIINGLVNGLLIPIAFAYLFLGGSAALRDMVPGVAAYALVFYSLLALAQFPLRFFSGFALEHKYGLSNQNLNAWLKDYFKGFFISCLFFVPAVFSVYSLLHLNEWWIYAGIGYSVLTLFLYFVFPIVIFPFFYKVAPYRDAKMKKRLIKMAERFGKRIDNIFVAKESEKSKKANAMFSGIGSTKRIVLFDNLLHRFHKDEIETVIGHELGHYVNKDTMRYFLIDAIRIFPVLLIIGYLISINIGNFGISSMNDIASLPLFLLGYYALELAFMPLLNTYSRHREREADLFALRAANKPEAQESTEKRLADIDFVDDKPHPLVEFFLFTHPVPSKRVQLARDWKRR